MQVERAYPYPAKKGDADSVQIQVGEGGQLTVQKDQRKPEEVKSAEQIPWWARLHIFAYRRSNRQG